MSTPRNESERSAGADRRREEAGQRRPPPAAARLRRRRRARPRRHRRHRDRDRRRRLRGRGRGEDFPAASHIQPLSGSVNDSTPTIARARRPHRWQGDLQSAAAKANCDLDLDLPDEGNTHLEADDEPPNYDTNPPTSGDHVIPPRQQADGAYIDAVEPIHIVHSLEHGRIDIQYSPDLPEEDQLALKGVFDEDAGRRCSSSPTRTCRTRSRSTAWTAAAGLRQVRRGRDARRDPRLPRHLSRPRA